MAQESNNNRIERVSTSAGFVTRSFVRLMANDVESDNSIVELSSLLRAHATTTSDCKHAQGVCQCCLHGGLPTVRRRRVGATCSDYFQKLHRTDTATILATHVTPSSDLYIGLLRFSKDCGAHSLRTRKCSNVASSKCKSRKYGAAAGLKHSTP